MENLEGQNVELYIPRKWCVVLFVGYKIPETMFLPQALRGEPWTLVGCVGGPSASSVCGNAAARIDDVPLVVAGSSWTNRLIEAKDHAAVQVNVGTVDPETGRYTGEFKTFALCGYIRDKGEGDMALTTLVDRADAEA